MEEKQIIVGKTSSGMRAFCWGLSLLGITLFLILLGVSRGLDYETSKTTLIFGVIVCLLLSVPCLVLALITDCEITVTDKRVYGKAALGKRVDLPLDSISAVSRSNFLIDGIAVATSSGRISFRGISNSQKIYEAINGLLIVRQDKSNNVNSSIKQEMPLSDADELKKFKELLDSGVITQDEFDAKKKQLLGL